MTKMVVCIEPVKGLLKPMQEYEVYGENETFYLVRYLNTWKGWWKKSRFEELPQGVNND